MNETDVMTALTPQRMRELAEGLAAANTENHRSGQHIPAVADRAVAALRAAADQLEAVQKLARARAATRRETGDRGGERSWNDVLAILTADTAPQEDRDV